MGQAPTDWLTRARTFFADELWRVEPEKRSRLSAIRLLQFSIMVVEGFVRDNLLLRASALTYFTVLSLVPMLAVAVSIASGVGIGSTDFVDWIIDSVAAGSPEAAGYIRPLIGEVSFAGLGTIGGGMLFVTTVLAIGNVESTLNHIWGVERGRGYARQFSDYLAVLVVAPLLGGLALSLTATLESQWLLERLLTVSAFESAYHLGLRQLPTLMLGLAFAFLYWFLPNTPVRFVSAALGGAVAAVLVVMAQSAYVDFGVGATRASTFFGGFALLPLLFVWIYTVWSIVLLGAEIAFAHQNLELYRQEVRGDPAGPAEREAIGLRIAVEVARTFRSGGDPGGADDLASSLKVPVRTVRGVTTSLLEAGILSTRTLEAREEGLQLGRPADRIQITDVLRALRGTREPAAVNSATSSLVRGTLDELEGAVAKAAGGRTLADLLAELPAGGDVDPPRSQG